MLTCFPVWSFKIPPLDVLPPSPCPRSASSCPETFWLKKYLTANWWFPGIFHWPCTEQQLLGSVFVVVSPGKPDQWLDLASCLDFSANHCIVKSFDVVMERARDSLE